jgi:hypothetical protein
MWQVYTRPTSASDFLCIKSPIKKIFFLQVKPILSMLHMWKLKNLQCVESIHAPDLRIRFLIIRKKKDRSFFDHQSSIRIKFEEKMV